MNWLCKYLHRLLGEWFQDQPDARGFPSRRECRLCGRLWFRGAYRGDRWECGGWGAGRT